jgi:hypothetical protein
MSRNYWNFNSPDVVGIEFQGIGGTTNIIQTGQQMRALHFHAQRSGIVDTVAVYCGRLTNDPVLSNPIFFGKRKPFIVEIIPVSGFDPGGIPTINRYTSNIYTSANCVNQAVGAIVGNELAAANDGLFAQQTGPGPATLSCNFLNTNTFPSNRQVMSIGIESSALRTMRITRIDHNIFTGWSHIVPAGPNTWDMGEAVLQAPVGGSDPWELLSPQFVQLFNNSGGQHAIQYDALDTQSNIIDYLGLTVSSIPERRAGVATIEPSAPWTWVTGSVHQPNVTGAPATVTSGGDYIILVRVPGGDTDYGSNATLDFRSASDVRPNGGFQHYTRLDWDMHDVETWADSVPRGLGSLVDGLASVRLLAGGAQTVDSQPYSMSSSGVVPFAADQLHTDGKFYHRPRQQMTVPAGATKYRAARINIAILKTAANAPSDRKSVTFELLNTAENTVLAGPFQITEAMYDASPAAGNDVFNDPYRTVMVDFGVGIDINEAAGVRARFTLDPTYGEPGKTNNVWRIGTMFAEINVGTGDQTAAGAATGAGFIPPSNAFLEIPTWTQAVADLQISLLSEPPQITGSSITLLNQAVTGGRCDPCPPFTTPGCAVTQIPYHHVCWTGTTLTQDRFSYYEVQRQETNVSLDWFTVAIIPLTGTPISGAAVTGVPTCFDDWSHVYDSQVCYRIRQVRTDGAAGAWSTSVCRTTTSPAGADVIITAPDQPTLNVAFPEAHAKLPITQEWTNLDADQWEFHAIYGRDKHVAFRPLERLGLRFKRRLMVSALCTPVAPCLNVTDGIREIGAAPVGYLVVRDRCGNRWISTVQVPTLTQLHDPDIGDIWLVDIEVTELADPIITPESVGVVTG